MRQPKYRAWDKVLKQMHRNPKLAAQLDLEGLI